MSSLQRSYVVVMPQHLPLTGKVVAVLKEAGVHVGKKTEMKFKKADLPNLRNLLPGILVEQPAPEIEDRPHIRINISAENLGEKLRTLQSHTMSGESKHHGYGDVLLEFQFRDACWWPGNGDDTAKLAEFFGKAA
jgi:hypothetical protein